MARSKSKQKRRKIQICKKRREREKKLRKKLFMAKTAEVTKKIQTEIKAVPKAELKTNKKSLSPRNEEKTSSTEVNSPASL